MPENTEWTLFNHPIRKTFRITLADQVYDILCREIHSGRWQVGDRLPGTTTLAEISGLSHNVIQRALESLREDGYVRQEKRKGTFLQSVLPKGKKALGTIGIAMTTREESSSYYFDYVYLSRLHTIIKIATERGFTTEVKCLEENADWANINRLDGPFGDRVKGIISLHEFPNSYFEKLEEDQIPMVFLEAPSGVSKPTVHHDGFYAIYQSTKMLIEAGHTNIALYAGSPFPDCGFDYSLAGFLEAMNEFNIPVNQEAIDFSLKQEEDATHIREFLVKYRDATGIVTLTSAKARRMVAVCDILGIQIPNDISICSQSSAPMRQDDNMGTVSGSKASMENSVKKCFDILNELMSTREVQTLRVVLRPGIIEGDTVSAPRSKPISILGTMAKDLELAAS